MIYIGIIIVTVLIDLCTKMWAASLGLFHDIPVIEGFFHITYVQNTGMAWSLLSGQQGLLALVAAAAIGLMGWYLFIKKTDFLKDAVCLNAHWDCSLYATVRIYHCPAGCVGLSCTYI